MAIPVKDAFIKTRSLILRKSEIKSYQIFLKYDNYYVQDMASYARSRLLVAQQEARRMVLEMWRYQGKMPSLRSVPWYWGKVKPNLTRSSLNMTTTSRWYGIIHTHSRRFRPCHCRSAAGRLLLSLSLCWFRTLNNACDVDVDVVVDTMVQVYREMVPPATYV